MDQQAQDADALEARVRADLPPASTWTMPPRGYRQGLALCTLDGVSRQVVGSRADLMVAAFREAVGPDAETAGASSLEPQVAGPAEWLTAATDQGDPAAVVAALRSALTVLRDSGIETTADVIARLNDEGLNGPLAQAWTEHEALTHPMLADTAMLSGYLDPQVDQIISRYVADAIGAPLDAAPPARVIAVLTDVAERFNTKILPLEFAILRFVRS